MAAWTMVSTVLRLVLDIQNVDLRFVIATIMVFSAVVATTIRFSHEIFDPLVDALKIQGRAAIIARPRLQ